MTVFNSDDFIRLPLLMGNRKAEEMGLPNNHYVTYGVMKRSDIVAVMVWSDDREPDAAEGVPNKKGACITVSSGNEYIVPMNASDLMQELWGFRATNVKGTSQPRQLKDEQD